MNNNKEEMFNKIIATNIALQVFNLMGYVPNNILQYIKQINLNLLNDDYYFNYEEENVKNNIYNGGLVIIDNLRIIDSFCEEDMKIHINQKTKWLRFWYSWLNSYLKDLDEITIPANMGIVLFDKISKYLDIEYEFVESYAENINEQHIKEMFFKDLQLGYDSILVCKIYNKEVFSNIETVLDSNIKYWFYETYPPSIFINDIFYGVVLSDKFSYKYDAKKIVDYISDYVENKKVSVLDLYYISSIYKKLNNNNFTTKFEKIVIKTFGEVINNNDDIRIIYYSLALDDTYNLNLSKNSNYVKNLNKEYIESQILNFNNEIELYYTLMVANLLKINVNHDLVYNSILNFYNENGYFVNNAIRNIDSIFSTFRMLELIDIYNIEFETTKFLKILNYIKNLKGELGGYYMTKKNMNYKNDMLNYKNNFTLQSFYYGVLADEIINKLINNRTE